MQTMAAFEAKTHFSKLLMSVEKGEEITITKHGHAVAKIIPIYPTGNITKLEAIERMELFSQKHLLNEWFGLERTA